MPATKITKRAVDSIKATGRVFYLTDTEVSGFAVRVRENGTASYILDYRPGDGGRRTAKKRVTIGAVGTLTPDEARREAQKLVGEVRKGGDPAGERATRRTSMTVSELCDVYLNAAEKGHILGKRGSAKKASTLYVDRGRIERHIKPLLGRKLVRDLTQADIARFIRDVSSGKTAADVRTEAKRGRAIVEGGAGTAARTAGLLGGILSFAVSEGTIPFNPATGVKRPADKRRQRRLTPAEYKALGAALATAESEGETPQGIAGVRLLALTGCRLGEIEALKWSEVDIQGRALRLTDSKEGASVRPLGSPAAEIIAGIARTDPDFVLAAVRGATGHFGGMPAALRRIVTKAKLEGVTAHTLRHSFASTAGDLGFSEPTIAALLGHAAGSVTSRYVHHLDSVLIAAADRVARTIHAQMTGEAADVIAFPGTTATAR